MANAAYKGRARAGSMSINALEQTSLRAAAQCERSAPETLSPVIAEMADKEDVILDSDAIA